MFHVEHTESICHPFGCQFSLNFLLHSESIFDILCLRKGEIEKMKVNDSVLIDSGVARVISCSSTILRGIEVWSATVEFNGLRSFIWGRFRRRKGVWVRIGKGA